MRISTLVKTPKKCNLRSGLPVSQGKDEECQRPRNAFETVFRQSQGEVYRWILRIVRDSPAAEDLTMETFWRIYRASFLNRIVGL